MRNTRSRKKKLCDCCVSENLISHYKSPKYESSELGCHAAVSTYPLLVLQQLLRLVLIQLLGAVRWVSTVVQQTHTNRVSIHAAQKRAVFRLTNHIMYLFSRFKRPCKDLPGVKCHAFSVKKQKSIMVVEV